ncbi:MAG TPA: hypothetical protein VK806_05570 [Bacteroidia bacterium]|nr:hypothetical protein [Bacteroidia bacterium]
MKKAKQIISLESRLKNDFSNENVYGIRLIDTYKLGKSVHNIDLEIFQYNSLQIFSRNLGEVVKDQVNIFDVDVYFQLPLTEEVKLVFKSSSEKSLEMVSKYVRIVPLQYQTMATAPYIRFLPIRSRAFSLA